MRVDHDKVAIQHLLIVMGLELDVARVDKKQISGLGGGGEKLIQNGRFREALNQNMPFSGSFLHILQ